MTATSDLPPQVRFVGAQLWDPPAAAPAWLDEPGDPWVLVTTSTEYQAEELARVTVEALCDEPVRVILTLADAYDTAEVITRGERARRALRPARPGARRGPPRRGCAAPATVRASPTRSRSS